VEVDVISLGGVGVDQYRCAPPLADWVVRFAGSVGSRITK